MKRRCLLAFVMLLVLFACSENKDVVSNEVGSLYIASTVESVELLTTRAEADVNQFTLILENESNPEVTITGLFSEFPNGTIEDVPVGNYDLTLTSHPDGFVPAFEDPWYEGLKSQIPVASGRTTMVSVECVQANAGITFIYDPSLEQVGLGGIVPEMKQDDATLYFEGENREAKAYFLPKPVELRIKLGDEYLMISGKESQTLDLGKEQLWETTLKASQVTGKLSIIATVKVITEPTHFIEFELGDRDPVEVTGIEIGSRTASFLAKGTNITAMRFGLFATASVDFMLNLGFSPEDFMGMNGSDLEGSYLTQLNTTEGLLMNFDGMEPLTAYTLMIMPTQNNMRKVQRYDFVSIDGIRPDPNQDPNGPIVPGTYVLNIYQEENDSGYADPYENQITVTKAVQDNIYIINNLFLASDIDLIAEYNENMEQLVFTGKEINGHDVFNDITFILNDGEFYAGIYLTDGENLVDELVFTVENRKLSKTATVMEFRLFDGLTEDDLGWLEISPLHNPFTYVGPFAATDQESPALLRNRLTRFPAVATRTTSSHGKGKVELRSSVSVVK